MKILGIIQARMGSTRLPGKCLKTIKNKSILQHCIDRIFKSEIIDQLVIATSTNKENDIIADNCSVPVFRGSEDDCLDRFYECAKQYQGDIIVRFTSDCPLIDPTIIDDMIEYFNEERLEYLKNTWYHNSYPSGFDVEIFTFKALEKHWKYEKDLFYREHVLTTYEPKTLYKPLDSTYLKTIKFNINLTHLSIDTSDDFEVVKQIIESLDEDFTFYDVIRFLNTNKHLVKTNMDDNRIELYKLMKL